MCIRTSYRPLPSIRYDGGRILHDCVLPAARPATGRAGGGRYGIDVREFLSASNNALLHDALRGELRAMLKKSVGAGGPVRGRFADRWDFFQSREPGSFDFRAHAVAAFVARRIAYARDAARDFWQFPAETLHRGRGDCEDIAFLLASLMLASGISGYNVRVALGHILETNLRTGRRRAFDHVWTAYRTERGDWTVIEPLLPPPGRGRSKKKSPRGEPRTRCDYIPAFAWNTDHLWDLAPHAEHAFGERASLRRRWTRFHPRFAGRVHRSILDDALASQPGTHEVLLRMLNSRYTAFCDDPLLTVDSADLPWSYHPYDHFDSAYIFQGWQRVKGRMESCLKPDNADMVSDFALAAHGVADFYAHSTYAHFARLERPGAIAIAKDGEWNDVPPGRAPDYSPGSDFDISSLRTNPNWNGTEAARLAAFNGNVISGRWRLPGDLGMTSDQLLWLEEVPRPQLKFRYALPHHNDIAVDEHPNAGGKNAVYTPAQYWDQYHLRYDAAVRHISFLFSRYGAELSKLG